MTAQREQSTGTSERWLKGLLILNGLGALAFAPGMFMPHDWLMWCVSHIRPALPDLPLVSFLVRELAGFYVLLGILLLVFANDVRRYAWPIMFTMLWCWLLGGALFLAGLFSGAMLFYHRFFQALHLNVIYGAIMTVVVLTLLRRVTQTNPAKSGEQTQPPRWKGRST